ncbi:MAG: SseB family protein [Paracoccus sp. (in: a-proteobacteria)]|uniref:SseB family protein n=1 Tax=Paracoccus sp. TaxID=267 RepID=UPI0039E24BF5
MTPLDMLCPTPFHEADAGARARVLSRLADTELFAALTQEPADDRADLQIYELPTGAAALACDLPERLAEFVGGPVAYVALPGRVLAAALAAEGRGLLVNPGAPSQLLLDAEALAWLVQALQARPNLAPEGAPRASFPPQPGLVSDLVEPLSQRLADVAGVVRRAALFQAEWSAGVRRHVLLLQGVAEARRDQVAKAFAELLAFLPEQARGVDIAFSEITPPAHAVLLEPPELAPEPVQPQRDSGAPPRLRW